MFIIRYGSKKQDGIHNRSGSGIGLATAKKLLAEGANVVVFSKEVDDALRNEFAAADKVLVLKGNVRFRNQVKKAMRKAVKKFGLPDILINNAGVAKRENFTDTVEKDWDFIFDVNVKGVFICTQEFANIRQKKGNTQEGLVINIGSGVGIYGSAGLAVYSASKAAVINISQSLNDELRGENMKFVAVCPGSTDTKMYHGLFAERKPHHTPEQVADVIYKTITGEIKPDDRLIVDVFHHAR